MTNKEFYHRIATGWFRSKYGLETDSGSRYHRLRMDGLSDFEAQCLVFWDYQEVT